MKRYRKIIHIFFAVILSASLAACAGSDALTDVSNLSDGSIQDTQGGTTAGGSSGSGEGDSTIASNPKPKATMIVTGKLDDSLLCDENLTNLACNESDGSFEAVAITGTGKEVSATIAEDGSFSLEVEAAIAYELNVRSDLGDEPLRFAKGQWIEDLPVLIWGTALGEPDLLDLKTISASGKGLVAQTDVAALMAPAYVDAYDTDASGQPDAIEGRYEAADGCLVSWITPAEDGFVPTTAGGYGFLKVALSLLSDPQNFILDAIKILASDGTDTGATFAISTADFASPQVTSLRVSGLAREARDLQLWIPAGALACAGGSSTGIDTLVSFSTRPTVASRH